MTENIRRKPLQARALATQNAILEAALQILNAPDDQPLTTNHIAERAGVSIGTLYQYFSNLDDILVALGQRQAQSDRERIADILKNQPEFSSIRAIVRVLTNSDTLCPAARMRISDALFRIRGQSVMSEHHQAFLDSLGKEAKLGFPLTREAAFVLTHAIVGLLRAAAAEPELELDKARLEDELVRMMESYVSALLAARNAS